MYRFTFFIRHLIYRIARPTKHKLLRIITNRYTVHAMMVILVGAVVFVNFGTREVRAQTFGQKSILYSLVAVDDLQTVDVVTASDRVVTTGTNVAYLKDTILDASTHVDLNYFDESYVTPTTGAEGTTVPSVPVREEIEIYVVQEGDTLGQISEKFGLNLSTVLWANNLTFRSTIQPGQNLSILPSNGILYTVKSGDTLSRIARRYNVESEKILEQNKIASADRLSIGVELLIPGGEPISQAPRRSAPVANLFVSPSTQKVTEGYWLWPTDWRVITQYYNWRHTGVDIDGDYTTNSYAARDGVVIYSGWRGGYGLTVEVDHGDGYVTRYAHHSKNFVSVGDVVKAGDALARTGTTGRSTGTHLHFEVIKKGKFQNPLDYVR
ncbi:M23 family metallopeptidase [Candidatus Uhrbacteria bacterium]|nr:M23 family metallopeptidase [Candidatus Uhrbacteria bacterium]